MLLETERLYLREFVLDDAMHLYTLNLDKEVLKYTGDISFSDERSARKFIQDYNDYEKNKMGRYAVILKETNEFIGWCGLKLHPKGVADIGFRFYKSMWGNGYATEAATACITYGHVDLKIKHIIGRTHPDNRASQQVLKKIGMSLKSKKIVEGIGEAMIYGYTRTSEAE